MQHLASWQDMWLELRLADPGPGLLQQLLDCYREPHRAYHTLQHLDACLGHFAAVREIAIHPAEVELALWLHDAVYRIGEPDNEHRSAEWAKQLLLDAGAAMEVALRVRDLVMTTCHDRAPRTPDQELLLDVDLAILGAPPARFDEYENQVRREYASVPEAAFRTRRRGVLQQFMARGRIYHTAYFARLCETQARANLSRSIRMLGD